MKTLPAIAFIAALAAFFLSPLNFETAVSLFFAAGISTIMIVDYSKSCRPLAVRAAALPVAVAPHKERFGLAA